MLKWILKFLKISINSKIEKLPKLEITEINNNDKKVIESPVSLNEADTQPSMPQREDNVIELLIGNKYKNENIKNLEEQLINKYFNDSDSLVEKKYKLVILSLAFEQKDITLSKNPIIDQVVKNIAQELIDNNETSINLYEIFNKCSDYRYMELMMAVQFPELRKITGTAMISQILNEDGKKLENIDIAKKIYKQFSSLGFLANTFIDGKPNTDIFMQLQDGKFTDGDITVLKNFVVRVSDPKYDRYHAVKLSLPYWETLMLNEKNIDNLNVFKQLFLHSDGKMHWYSSHILYGQNNREEARNHLTELVEKRISYIEVSNYLDLQPQEEKQKRKQPKL